MKKLLFGFAFGFVLFALPLHAANSILFDPPNPTERTPILAHMRVATGCPPASATVTKNGRIISISVKPRPFCPAVPPPADGYPLTVDLGNVAPGTYDVVAGLDSMLLLLAEGTLTVRQANPPFTVMPDVAAQPENITINGLTLPACSVGACAAPLVTFGDAQAPIVTFQPPSTLVVQVPQHAPGTVDVTVKYQGQTYTATSAFHFFSSDAPDDRAFFEPVLFPVIASGPGANGSNWTTDVALRNENDYTLPVNSIFDEVCFPVCDVRPPGHSTRFVTGINLPNGYLLNVPRQAAPKLFFGTLVRDLSRQAEALGAEIPVVREDHFFDEPFTLTNVTADTRFRVALRLYRIDGGTSLQYAIRPTMADTPVVIGFATLTPVSPGSNLTSAFLGDVTANHPEFALKGPLRITIYPPPGAKSSWGFASVTNNATQHVTILSPQ